MSSHVYFLGIPCIINFNWILLMMIYYRSKILIVSNYTLFVLVDDMLGLSVICCVARVTPCQTWGIKTKTVTGNASIVSQLERGERGQSDTSVTRISWCPSPRVVYSTKPWVYIFLENPYISNSITYALLTKFQNFKMNMKKGWGMRDEKGICFLIDWQMDRQTNKHWWL